MIGDISDLGINWSVPCADAADYASFEAGQGEGIVRHNGVDWRRVRPFFYRPLLPFQVFDPSHVSGPFLARLGGMQYAVANPALANSKLNLLVFENASEYSVDELDRYERRDIRRALKLFRVNQSLDVSEFKRDAFPVYLSFFGRTGYRYKTERRTKTGFANWAESVFNRPNPPLVLGAFRNGSLAAVGIAYQVGGTFLYFSFFCDTESLRLHVTGVMLHTMRQTAASCGAKEIFIGLRTKSSDFYIDRGCRVRPQPAKLALSPIARLILRRFMPRAFTALSGSLATSPKQSIPPEGRVILTE